MELSIENLARAAFPRTAAAQGAKMPRRLLSGIMDAASFPGRTLMAAADATGPTMTLGDIIANQSISANSTDFLSSMGRTGAMPGRSRADAISESIIRDPISVLGLGAGSLAKAVGGKVAAATGSKVAPKLASYVTDLLANSGTDAASQYAATGAIDPRQMALGAGLGLGMQGLGAGVMKMAPKVTQNPNFQKWFGDSKVVDADGKPLVVYHGTASDFSEFMRPKAMDKEGRRIGMGWGKGKFYFADNPDAASVSADWAGKSKDRPGNRPSVMPVYLAIKNPISADDYMAQVRERIASGMDRDAAITLVDSELKRQNIDGIVDHISGGHAVFASTQIKSATGNRGTFDPTDPNITHLTGGGTQLPSLRLPGFAKRLGSRYMNDTTATSGRY